MSDNISPEEFRSLVNRNGLVKLFANRARARILVTLFYFDQRVAVKEIADGANVSQTTVHEAMAEIEKFDIVQKYDKPSEQAEYELRQDDELVQEIKTLAELATNRFYDRD